MTGLRLWKVFPHPYHVLYPELPHVCSPLQYFGGLVCLPSFLRKDTTCWRGCWRGLCLALLWVAPSWQSLIFTALFRTRMWCCGAWSHMSTWYHLSSLVNFIWRTVLTGRITGGFPTPLILWHTTTLKIVVLSIYGPPWAPHQRGIFPWALAVSYKSYPR